MFDALWVALLDNVWAVALLLLLITTTSGRLFYLLRGHHTLEKDECIVIVTGCDSGFGLSSSILMAERGFCVVANCYTKAGAAALTMKKMSNLHALAGDVTKDDDVAKLLRFVEGLIKKNKKRKLWALVNNAGVAPMGHIAIIGIEEIRHAMNVNYFGVVMVTKAFIPLLKHSPESRVINVSSMAGLAAGPGFGAYSASKHALQGISAALREELRPFRIHVACVNPCFMRTPMISASVTQAKEIFDAAPEDVRRQYREDALVADGAVVNAIAEDPTKVVRFICDTLITARHPHFFNPVGIQAGVLRYLLLLPKAWIEFFSSLFAPTFKA